MKEQNKTNPIRILIVSGILLLALGFIFLCWQTSLFGLLSPRAEEGFLYTDGKKTNPETVLTIGDYTISFSEYRHYYLNEKRVLDGGDPSFFKTYPGYKQVLKDRVIKAITQNYAALHLASLNGINLTEAQQIAADEAIEKFIGEKGEDAYVDMLNEAFLTESLYRKMFDQSLIKQNAYDFFFGKNGKYALTDEAYLKHFSEEYLAVLHIFIPYETKEDQYSHEKTMQKAQTVYQEAIAENADFYTLYKKYNKVSEMEIPETGCYFTQENAPYQIYYETAESTPIDGISEPFATYAGICIIKRIHLSDTIALEQKDQILNGNESEIGYYETQFENMYNQIAEDLQIKFDRSYDLISTDTVF